MDRFALRETYPAVPGAARAARQAVDAVAADTGASEEIRDRVMLAVSEAVTNAILHAYDEDGGTVTLAVDVTDGVLDVSVSDAGCGLPAARSIPGLGLGIGLMAHEADRFEIERGDRGGTTLRMGFELGSQPQMRLRTAARWVAPAVR